MSISESFGSLNVHSASTPPVFLIVSTTERGAREFDYCEVVGPDDNARWSTLPKSQINVLRPLLNDSVDWLVMSLLLKLCSD